MLLTLLLAYAFIRKKLWKDFFTIENKLSLILGMLSLTFPHCFIGSASSEVFFAWRQLAFDIRDFQYGGDQLANEKQRCLFAGSLQ